MPDVLVSDLATATPTSSSTVVGETGGVVNRFAVSDLVITPLYGADGTVLESFGDSIVKGEAVTNPFPALVATDQGWTQTNRGINSAETHDAAKPLYATAIGDTENVIVACGINNMRVSAGAAAKLKYFQESHAALVAFAAIPDSKKLMATDAAITYTGTWASNDTYANGVDNKYSITQGDAASFTVSGSVIYIGLTMVETKTGQAKVTVDGVDKGTYSCAAPGITTTLGQAFGPKLVRIVLPQGGRHDVTLTITSATGANNNVFVDWVAGNEDAAGSKVYVGNITYMNAAGYVTYGGSEAYTDTYNLAIYENCALLANDGLYVHVVDVNSVIDPLTDLADNIHPTQAGYNKIANEYIAVIDARVRSSATLPFRGKALTTAESAGYAGAEGELSYDKDLDACYVHDGATAGGARIASFGSGKTYTALGYQALNSTGAATDNTAVGYQAGHANTTGDGNAAFGKQASYTNTTGNYNCSFGFGAMYFNASGSNGSAFGYQSLFKTTASNNTAVGYKTLRENVGGADNTALGHNSMATNVSGNYNTAVGSETLNASTGDLNTACGFGTLYATTTGTNNTAVGARAGFGPGGVGGNTTGSNNTFVGNGAVGSAPGASNEVTLGNASVSALRCQVALTVLSDERDKIKRGELPGLDFLMDVDTFLAEWNKRDGSENPAGTFASLSAQNLLAAQDRHGVELGLVNTINPDRLQATYERLIPVLVRGMQQQQATIQALQSRLSALENNTGISA